MTQTNHTLNIKTAILAGGGDVVLDAIEACKAQGRDVFVIGFDGQEYPEAIDFKVPLGAAGALIDRMKIENVKDILFIGRIKRPSLLALKPDARGAKIMARIGLKSLGDDGLLTLVSEELAKEGFNLIGMKDVMPNILAPKGTWTTRQLNKIDNSDIARGCEVAKSLGLADVGQSVVVENGIVLAVEAIEGTDALLQRVAELKRLEEKAGVLVKLKKIQQSEKLDLPTVGLDTLKNMVDAGLVGLAVSADDTLVVGYQEMVDFANDNDLFIVGL